MGVCMCTVLGYRQKLMTWGQPWAGAAVNSSFPFQWNIKERLVITGTLYYGFGPWRTTKLGKNLKHVLLSRATLEFSFNSPNNISVQNISVWVQKFVWWNQILGRRKLGSEKSVVPKIWYGWSKFVLSPNNFGSKQTLIPKIVGPTFFLVQNNAR